MDIHALRDLKTKVSKTEKKIAKCKKENEKNNVACCFVPLLLAWFIGEL